MGLLRLLLALSVVTAHLHGRGIFGFRLLYGNLAVQCFFMISGFYMALVLNEKYNKPGDYLPFIWQRILRIYPAYLVVLILTLLVEGLVSLAAAKPVDVYEQWFSHASCFVPSTWITLIFTNLFILGKQFNLFQAVDPTTGSLFFTGHFYEDPLPASTFAFINQAWTLDLEMTFYLIAPLLVRRSAWVQVLVVLVSISLRVGTSWLLNPKEDPWHNDHFFPYELAFFTLGSVAYQVYRHQKPLLTRLSGFFSWFQWLFLAIVLFYSRLPGSSYTRYFIFIPLLFLMIPWLFFHTRNNSMDRLMGELSYPIYLVHILVIFLMRMWVPSIPQVLQGPLYTVMIIGIAYVIYRRVDERIDDFRHRLFERQRSSQTTPVIVAAETVTP